MRLTKTLVTAASLLFFTGMTTVVEAKAHKAKHHVAEHSSHKGGKHDHVYHGSFSEEQLNNLSFAHKVGVRDGLWNPKILQGILLQESRATNPPIGKHSYYGVGQIKVGTAMEVLDQYPHLKTDYGVKTRNHRDIAKKLASDPRFNIEVASKLLKNYHEEKPNDSFAIAAYNLGLGGARQRRNHDNLGYVKEVKHKMTWLASIEPWQQPEVATPKHLVSVDSPFLTQLEKKGRVYAVLIP
ncbi:MAG: transglycosylase SLT domain-containing protein [Candidatus Nitrosotenuis sp.]